MFCGGLCVPGNNAKAGRSLADEHFEAKSLAFSTD
jgi:hypothetical protein